MPEGSQNPPQCLVVGTAYASSLGEKKTIGGGYSKVNFKLNSGLNQVRSLKPLVNFCRSLSKILKQKQSFACPGSLAGGRKVLSISAVVFRREVEVGS